MSENPYMEVNPYMQTNPYMEMNPYMIVDEPRQPLPTGEEIFSRLLGTDREARVVPPKPSFDMRSEALTEFGKLGPDTTPTPEASFLQTMHRGISTASKFLEETIMPPIETTEALISGIASFPISRGAKMIALGKGKSEEEAEAIEMVVAQKFTFKPRTPMGQKASEILGTIVSLPAEIGRELAMMPVESWELEGLGKEVALTAGELAAYAKTGQLTKRGVQMLKARKIKPEVMDIPQMKGTEPLTTPQKPLVAPKKEEGIPVPQEKGEVTQIKDFENAIQGHFGIVGESKLLDGTVITVERSGNRLRYVAKYPNGESKISNWKIATNTENTKPLESVLPDNSVLTRDMPEWDTWTKENSLTPKTVPQEKGEFVEGSVENFIKAREQSKRPHFFTEYDKKTLESINKIELPGERVGFGLTKDKDIVRVYNNSGKKGLGSVAVVDALSRGGKTLDCYAGHLDELYKSLDFKETRRIKWNDKSAPKDWNYAEEGRPDVVFLKHEGEVNVDNIKRSYKAEWDRELDSDPTAREVLNKINERLTGKIRGGLDRGIPATTSGRTGSGVQGSIKPTEKPQIPTPTKAVKEAGEYLGFGPASQFQKLFKKGVSKKSELPEYARTAPDGDAAKVEAMYNKADGEIELLTKTTPRKVYQTLKRATIDVSGNVKKELLKRGGETGKEAVMRHDLIRGAGPKSERIIEGVSKEIYSDLTKAEEKVLNRVIQSRRTIAIEKYKPDVKHPEGLGLSEHQAYLDNLPPKTLAKLNVKADIYFKEMNNQLGELRKAGLITEEAHQSLLKSGDYSPRNFLNHIDPERTYQLGGQTITVPDSGIKKLDTGSFESLNNNARQLLTQVVTRTQARIFRNEANVALHNLAQQIPDNGIIQSAKVIGTTKAGKPIYQKPPAGYETISVMVDGKSKELFMPTDMAKEWIVSDPAINTQVANVVGWLSGSKILKPMATGLNPGFAVANLPRDIAHVWITTHEYSPHIPVAAPQIAMDLLKVLPDTLLRKGRWNQYIDEGGGMSFLTHQGHVTGKTSGSLAMVQKVLGYVGETSEIMTRLALRERAIKNGKLPHEATWIARNYLDFSQGGQFIKAMDTGMPYLNASVQATRGIFRSASQKPGTFVYKTAQLGTLATGLYLANKFNNPECWESISERDKVNNFIITTPWSYKDSAGNKRHLYFKIAKDQSQRIVATVFENLMGKYLGDDIDIDQITQAAQDFIPIIPTQKVPPTIDAMMGYFANKDFWRNEDIWKGGQVTPREEWNAYTHPGYVKAGEVTGLSPERTRYALEQYFTSGNIYTALVSGGMSQVFKKMPVADREKETEEIITRLPIIKRAFKSTSPYEKYREKIETAKIEESTKRHVQSRKLDMMFERYYQNKTTEARKGILDTIQKEPQEDRIRLRQRFIRYGKLYQIPDRRWWLNLAELSPEARATIYWTRYQQAPQKEKDVLKQQLNRIPGIVSDRFKRQFLKLRRKTND